MSKFKIQMPNDGVRTTSTNRKFTDTLHEHETRTRESLPNVKESREKVKVEAEVESRE
jgi:hypothetical protein